MKSIIGFSDFQTDLFLTMLQSILFYIKFEKFH